MADQDGMVMLGELDDGIIDTKLTNECAFIFCGIANRVEDTQEVESRDRVFVPQFLHRAGEDFWNSKRCSDRRREANKLLERLKHVFEIGLGELRRRVR